MMTSSVWKIQVEKLVKKFGVGFSRRQTGFLTRNEFLCQQLLAEICCDTFDVPVFN